MFRKECLFKFFPMKKHFVLFLCLLTIVLWNGSCNNDPKTDPCETDPQPGCPNYVDPCETDPQPGCPNYVDPCEDDPQPGCPNYDPETPVLGNTITIATVDYAIDETKIEKIDDGFWYMSIQLKNATKPLVIHTLRYTTTTTGYSIETWVGNDSITGKERPSAMADRYEKAGRQVRMAINGGFYGTDVTGTPISMQATKGLLTFLPVDNYPIIGFDNQNLPYMDSVRLNSKMKIEKNNSEWDIISINGGRWTDFLVLYNEYKGKRTNTNPWGIEVLCEPVAAKWNELDNHINVRCKVEQVATQGNMEIPKGKIVLSGHGTAHTYMSTLQADDYVSVTVDYALKTKPEITSATIRNVVSGWNIILNQNNIVPPPGWEAAIEDNSHPRTCVGFTNDKKYVFFTVVEGRNPTQANPDISAGVSTTELAQVMQYFGAQNAINLDGGGSSCIMIDKETKNFLSDGAQRAVADGLAIIKK